MADSNDIAIAVIGLGYVGLPLAAAFADAYPVQGFDINEQRVTELRKGIDSTLELSTEDLAAPNLQFTCNLQDIASSNVYIVTVPTPIDPHCQSDLRPLISASTMLAGLHVKGALPREWVDDRL